MRNPGGELAIRFIRSGTVERIDIVLSTRGPPVTLLSRVTVFQVERDIRRAFEQSAHICNACRLAAGASWSFHGNSLDIASDLNQVEADSVCLRSFALACHILRILFPTRSQKRHSHLPERTNESLGLLFGAESEAASKVIRHGTLLALLEKSTVLILMRRSMRRSSPPI